MISPLGKAGGDLTGTGVIVDVTGRPIMQEENSGKVVRDKNCMKLYEIMERYCVAIFTINRSW